MLRALDNKSKPQKKSYIESGGKALLVDALERVIETTNFYETIIDCFINKSIKPENLQKETLEELKEEIKDKQMQKDLQEFIDSIK